jgi:alpha-galactosidase
MRLQSVADRLLIAFIALATIAGAVTAVAPRAAAEAPESSTAQGSYNGLALTPPMGFNNWAGFECSSRFGEKLFLDTADALVRLGLDNLGYNYVNIDDCWMQHDRDASGNLQVDTTRFPGTDPRLPAGSSANPLRALGDYLHAKGLKFGIYEDAGYRTCQGAAGSYGHFQQDANLYASWGVDYLKLDYCNQPLDQFPHKSRAQVAQIVYTEASQALLDTGRDIVFSASAPAYECCSGGDFWQEFQWLPKLSNLWRFGSDISDNWQSVVRNYTEGNTPGLPEQGGPGHWNDADMFEIGNGGLSLTEEQSQFTLWSEMASPLLLSTEVADLSPAELSIVSNRDVIAVDQDPLGKQGRRLLKEGDLEVWVRPLAGGDHAVVLLNRGKTPANMKVAWEQLQLPIDQKADVKDLWSKKVTKGVRGSYGGKVAPHGVITVRITPAL